MNLRTFLYAVCAAFIVPLGVPAATSEPMTERVSVDSAGAQANADSGIFGVAISADGRFVAFASGASNLVAGDTNGASDVFIHDRATGQTERVSVDSTGVQGNSGSFLPAVSADGRFVAFGSAASNLVARVTNGAFDIFGQVSAGIDVFVQSCDRADRAGERRQHGRAREW